MINCEAFDIGCDNTARLMKLAGAFGRRRGRLQLKNVGVATRSTMRTDALPLGAWSMR